MAAKEIYKTEKIKKLDKIFKAYTSGGKVFTNNIIKKMLISSVVLLAIVILSFYLVITTFLPSTSEEEININEQIQTVQTNQTTYTNNPNTQVNTLNLPIKVKEEMFELESVNGFILINLVCNKKTCFNNDYTISSKLFSILSDKKIIKVINQEYITKNSFYITIVTTPSFINLFEYKGVNDEKDISIGTDTKYTYTSQ
jgi:hypothetical protein